LEGDFSRCSEICGITQMPLHVAEHSLGVCCWIIYIWLILILAYDKSLLVEQNLHCHVYTGTP